MSFFAGLNAEKYDRQYSDRQLMARILEYFRPHLPRMGVILLGLAASSASGAAQPLVVSRGVDWVQQAGSALNPVLLVSGAVLALGVLNWLANYVNRRIMARVIAAVLARLSAEAFQSATAHDLSFYDQFSSGRIASRITTDTQDFGQLVQISTDIIAGVVEALILMVVLLNISVRLSLVTFAIIPLVFVFTVLYRRLARRVIRTGMRAIANVNAAIKETVSGISVAKNFRQEQAIYNLFEDANRTSYRMNVRRGLTLTAVFPFMNALGGIMTAVLIYAGGLTAAQGLVTAGTVYLFTLSLDRFMYPVMNLSSFWTQVQNGLAAAERVFALIDAEPSVVQVDSQPVPRLRGQVDFDHVVFRYKEGEPVLEDFDLHIAPGETVALVGHTGAGKSSVARLIARFYEFQGGGIRIDGRDIRAFDLNSYRCQLGIVTQTPFLFSASVLENIQYACGDAGRIEIERMAQQIGGGEWLETLPEGLDSPVGERGARLSMGQRQLVSLMRVLVQKPAIFVLDEATASIDPFTEWQIQQALNLILSRSTSLLIAHRLSTVKSADRIVVMDHGRIIEQGSHEQLLEAGGHYAGLYNTYFRHQSLEYRPSGLDDFRRAKLGLKLEGND